MMSQVGEILIIEDESGVRQVLARHLGEAGHRVQTASTLPQGLELLGRHPFDLVYCDIRLPGHSGLELLQHTDTFASIPFIIMMTGYPSLETAQQALRQGAFDYLVKPVLSEALLRSAALALNAKGMQDEKKRVRLHLEAVFDSVDNGLITSDPGLNLVAANRAASVICGFDASSGAGHPLKELATGCGGQCLAVLRQAMEQGQRVTVKRLLCGQERRIEQVVSVTATPMRTRQGELLGGVMAVHDETPLVTLEKRLARQSRFHRLIGGSVAMREIYQLVDNLADLETTVLILGESGTGKELVAEAIHTQGRRRERPLVKVNCVALSETLLESELFGHVRGSFTGALKDRVGRFQEADGGTLFLDEIGDISQAMQLRLLRVLQHKQIERVGDNRTLPVDVRIVAATNQDLRAKVEEGVFREDLYYRLKVVEIEVPPLRARTEDIPLLVNHFVDQFNTRFDRRIPGVAPEAMSALMDHLWPGNIRELEHAVEHAFVVCRGEEAIALEHLPRELRTVSGVAKPLLPKVSPRQLPESEQTMIRAALVACNWRREVAAKRLGMSRSTLFRKMRQWGIVDQSG
ncbi:MAG: sigma 54-interacting transcriptional regulator [Magnetococcales bacterium]|nr:sigma 54-interacting transcriptional regulator [Magnetococcales bacterium]